MTVTLNEQTQKIVQAELSTGRYATADEVVNRLIEEGARGEAALEAPPGPEAKELESSLLAAMSKPTRPFRKGEFVSLVQRALADERGA